MKKDKNTVSFWYQLWHKYGQLIALYAIISAITFLWSAIYALDNPAAGEAFAYNIVIVSAIMTAGFTAFVVASGVGVAAFFSSLLLGWGIRNIYRELNTQKMQNALPDYNGGDYLFIQDISKSLEDNKARIESVKNCIEKGDTLGILLYQKPSISIYRIGPGGEKESFIIDRKEMVSDFADTDFTQETPETFRQYAQYCAGEFLNYCENFRIGLPGANAVDVAAMYMKVPARIAVTFALLLFSVFAFAQTKTDRVLNGIGQTANSVPKSGAVISYTFQKGTVTRTGDGVKNIAALVDNGRPGANSDILGELVGIDIDGVAIAATREKHNAQDKETKERVRPLFASTEQAVNTSLPDSVSFNDKIKETDKIAKNLVKVWNNHAIAIALSNTFNYVLYFIVYLAFIFNYISNSAVSESRLGFYKKIKYGDGIYTVGSFFRFLAWICNVVCGVILLSYIAYCLFVEESIVSIFGIVFNWTFIKLIIMVVATLAVERIGDYFLKNPKHGGGEWDGNNGLGRPNNGNR